MTVDVNKIKVGDTLVIEAKVLEIGSGSTFEFKAQFGSEANDVYWIEPVGIIEHKPKPVEFKVGDIVYIKESNKVYRYKIISLCEDSVWCKNLTTQSFITYSIVNLEHVNED